MPIFRELSTPRLLLRPWRVDDAPELERILAVNEPHLAPWIPPHIARWEPVPQLVERMTGFAADFEADQKWRFAMRTRAEGQLLGELGLFPRSPVGRTVFSDADRVELGYWLRSDRTGHGYVTEAARAALDVIRTFPQFRYVEIHCDARNGPSAAIPARLGFSLAEQSETLMQTWRLDL